MSNSLENVINKVSAFVAKTVLLDNPAWRIGVGVGVASSVLFNVLNNWNFNLTFEINFLKQFERFIFSIVSPPQLIAETDLFRINMFRKMVASLPTCSTQKMKTTHDIQIPSPDGYSIPATVYTPISQVCSEIKRPIVIHMHGGGFVIGSVPMYAPITTTLASQTGFIVVGIEYRCAPEHKCPTAHLDCVAAVRWIHEHAASLGGDQDQIAVIGDSAGGNLAAAVSCELPGIVKLSVPVYPQISFGCMQSKVENYDMPILPAVMVDWFNNRYLRDADDLRNPLVCPLLRSAEELGKVCRTHVITAQYDVLRDEGLAYVKALKAVGVDVTHKNYDHTVHAFFGNATINHGMQAMSDVSKVIRDHFLAT